MKNSTVFDCSVIELSRTKSGNGNISVLENDVHIPFATRRVYYLYDVPGGESRGGHAHRELQQLIVAASGSFTVRINDGINTRSIHLNRPYHGLLMVPGLWRELEEFSSGSICLVMASHPYDEEDYIREYADFLSYKGTPEK